MAASEGLELVLLLPLPSSRAAAIALGALEPDPPPRRAGLRRELTARGAWLEARWWGGDARGLRAAAGSFLQLLGVALETMERLGDPPGTPPGTPPGSPPPNK